MAVLGEIGSPATHCAQGLVVDAWTGVDVQTNGHQKFPRALSSACTCVRIQQLCEKLVENGAPGEAQSSAPLESGRYQLSREKWSGKGDFPTGNPPKRPGHRQKMTVKAD